MKLQKPITLEQASEYAGCSTKTLIRCIKAGELVAYRIGSGVTVYPDDLMQFIKSRQIMATKRRRAA